jgi:glycerol-3-phosphate O-acyltransferase
MQIENVPRRFVCDSRKRTVLAFYKNNSIHCFVIPGILLLAYYQAWHRHDPRRAEEFEEAFREAALELRDILKFEFFFNPRAEFLEELSRSAAFFFGEGNRPDTWAENLARRFPVASDLSVLSRVPGELLESYLTFADFVQLQAEPSWEKKAMLAKAYRFAESRQAQGDMIFPESLSVVNYGNALLYLENQNIVKIEKDADKTTVTRIGNDDAVRAVIRKLHEFRDLIQEKEETFLKLPTLA